MTLDSAQEACRAVVQGRPSHSCLANNDIDVSEQWCLFLDNSDVCVTCNLLVHASGGGMMHRWKQAISHSTLRG